MQAPKAQLKATNISKKYPIRVLLTDQSVIHGFKKMDIPINAIINPNASAVFGFSLKIKYAIIIAHTGIVYIKIDALPGGIKLIPTALREETIPICNIPIAARSNFSPLSGSNGFLKKNIVNIEKNIVAPINL
tara:strand:+ start:4681 stop:5079 length:399 start_codon:yes stop_codon:yes gene_type:complete